MTIETPGWEQMRAGRRPKSRNDGLDELAALALGSGPGADLLDALRHRYFDGAFSSEAPETALRARIANQQFVLMLEQARDRGRAALDAAAKAKNPT